MVTVPVSATNATAFTIDPYEARITGNKAESLTGVSPEVNVDYGTAKVACETAGKRLCTTAEWYQACLGPNNRAYSFQDTGTEPVSISTICDAARTENNTPGSLPSLTGAHPNCKTDGIEVFDMIGNVAEWTTDSDGTAVAAGAPFYFSDTLSTCVTKTTDLGQETISPSTKSTDVGFRCCKDVVTTTGPGSSGVPTFPF